MSQSRLISAGLGNASYVDELYEKYSENPTSVDISWQLLFREMDTGVPASTPTFSQNAEAVSCGTENQAQKVDHLIQAYRTHGHRLARVNPIDPNPAQDIPELSLEMLGFRSADLSQSFPTCGILPKEQAPLSEIVDALKETYCNRVGVQYMGLERPDMEAWLQERIEPSRFQPSLSIEEKQMVLDQLNRSELFEAFLHTKFTGQKRFSIEGGETLIPMLAAIIERGSDLGHTNYAIGMAHRGRLNVLSNILQKSYRDIFSEFEDSYIPGSFEGSGDVKYHKGFESRYRVRSGREIQVELPPNPSHLEAVDAVVPGMVRARQVMLGDDIQMEHAMGILIHGDAAVAGQGIVYETMQFCGLPGYATGGTIHIVTNNQIGFTTLPKDGRSTRYCTDIARTFGAPVFHVNGDDPEQAVHVTNLAVELRQRFHCDVFIDLNCYRKYGHNESDEPAYTQPLEYQLIRKKQPVRELYRDTLIKQGVVERDMALRLEAEFKEKLTEALEGKDTSGAEDDPLEKSDADGQTDVFTPVDTTVSPQQLQELASKFCSVPEGFNIHRKLKKLVEQRLKMVQQEPDAPVIDWGMGEHLAFATLLAEGTHVRLSGQDSRRGTFSHRHAMWIDQVNAKKYFPLSWMQEDQGRFDVFNSPLSEYGVLGFEFGYSLAEPNALVLWEAQFGDFSNGAQIIIDQFIATSEQKWNRTTPLTLLLPHGYEGQGPEHSSARMERFLQLAGDENFSVVNPTTPAQLFHLLRRQVHRTFKKPLIVFTPKGLLRHPQCVSPLNAFSQGGFQEVIDDPAPPKKPKRVAFCNGRIYYDMVAEREARGDNTLALVRVEQLYPLHEEALKKVIKSYKGIEEYLWIQEEPCNMGAWDFIRPSLAAMLPKGKELRYVGRDRSASPAAGSLNRHKTQHQAICSAVFGKSVRKK